MKYAQKHPVCWKIDIFVQELRKTLKNSNLRLFWFEQELIEK